MPHPEYQMYRSSLHQPHVPVNAASRIPARVGLLGIIHPHGYHIRLAPFQVRSKVIAERNVPIRAMSQRHPVEEHFRIHIDPVEHDTVLLVRIGFFGHKCLPIPPDTSGQSTSARTRWIVLTKVALYRPIMRQIQETPVFIRKSDIHGLRLVSQLETPALAEIHPFADILRRCGARSQKQATHSA